MAKYKEQDEDLTAFERFEKEVKSTVFDVLFVMLKEGEDSFVYNTILNIADGFQTLGLIYTFQMNYPWYTDTFTVYFISAIQFLQLTYWCTLLSWTAFVAVFYCVVGIVFLAMCDIAFIAYSFSIKRINVMWPLHLLRNCVTIFVTVFFMPGMDMLTSMLQCNYNNGVWTFYAFPSIICWQGAHLIHSTVAGVFSILFMGICTIVSLTFFESAYNPDNPGARINARGEVYLNNWKFVFLLLGTFFVSNQFLWMNAIALLFGSCLIFIQAFNERPCYMEACNVVNDCTNIMFCWGSFSLCILMYTQNTNINCAVAVFVIAVPVLVLIMLVWPNGRKELLLKPLEQFETGMIWLYKINYYMLLIHSKESNRMASIELKGFIYDHEEICDKKDCPLKLYIQNIAGMVKDKKRKVGRNLGAENNHLLWSYANKLFQMGLSKFTSCTTLRISYAFFLKERMGNKNSAIKELTIAGKNQPPFDEQFEIYRYKKMMEEEVSEVQGEGNTGGQSANLDVVSIIAYDNHMRQCQEQIQQAAFHHKEFWCELEQRRPDLSKLSKTGSKINTTIGNVEEHWSKLQKINPNNPKALHMYGDFLIEILNDKDGGQELISRAKDNVVSRNSVLPSFYESSNSGSNAADLWMTNSGSDGTPCIIASGEQNRLGEITQINMGMCRTFGFTKNELIGKKVEILMHPIYSRQHESFIKSSLSRAEDCALNEEKQSKNVSDRGNTGRFILGRHRSGYLIPLWLETKLFALGSQATLVGATFKHEKKNFGICYLLLDAAYDIVGVSSLCVSAFGIANHHLKYFKISAKTLAPELFDESLAGSFRTKEGGNLKFFLPDKVKKRKILRMNLGTDLKEKLRKKLKLARKKKMKK